MFIMKDGKVSRPHLKIASSPSYTLAEIEQLAREYVKDCQIENSYNIPLSLSLFLTWLAKREQGKESER